MQVNCNLYTGIIDVFVVIFSFVFECIKIYKYNEVYLILEINYSHKSDVLRGELLSLKGHLKTIFHINL